MVPTEEAKMTLGMLYSVEVPAAIAMVLLAMLPPVNRCASGTNRNPARAVGGGSREKRHSNVAASRVKPGGDARLAPDGPPLAARRGFHAGRACETLRSYTE